MLIGKNSTMCSPLIRKNTTDFLKVHFKRGKTFRLFSREVREADAISVPWVFAESKDSLEGFPC
jgi:hypothetical protein